MPSELELTKRLKRERWKVKIQEKETREPPHVSILFKTKKWRINLRTGEFMDKAPKPSEVPEELLEVIRKPENWRWLREQWDGKYPDNPIEGAEN